MLRLVATVSVFLVAQCLLTEAYDNDHIFPTQEVVEANGYTAETHHVVSKDGYILEIHRIPFGKNSQRPEVRPVVFLMHGITAASNSFIYLGPEDAIAYNLADAGYDVWMGNARGTRNSRRHVSLDPSRNKLSFFDFSFEEIALDDLPTMIDYVLGQTRQEKLHYIGHSQGGTVFLVLNSMMPEYNAKFASAHLLAAVGYQRSFPNSQLKILSYTTDTTYNILRLAGSVELFPPGSNSMFGTSSSSRGAIPDSIFNIDASSVLIAGAALKQVAHFGQNIRDSKFQRWDHGIFNLAMYGRFTPPSYDLSKINVDVTLHYSLNDVLLSEKDTLAMANDLPHGKARKISRDSFSHVDYITSNDVKQLLTDFIIESLKKV